MKGIIKKAALCFAVVYLTGCGGGSELVTPTSVGEASGHWVDVPYMEELTKCLDTSPKDAALRDKPSVAALPQCKEVDPSFSQYPWGDQDGYTRQTGSNLDVKGFRPTMSLEDFVMASEKLGGEPYLVPAELAKHCNPASGKEYNTHPDNFLFCEDIARDIGTPPGDYLAFHDGALTDLLNEHAAFTFNGATIGGFELRHASFYYRETIAENGRLSMVKGVMLNLGGGDDERTSFASSLNRKFGFQADKDGYKNQYWRLANPPLQPAGIGKSLLINVTAPRDTVPNFFWVKLTGVQIQDVKKRKAVDANDL